MHHSASRFTTVCPLVNGCPIHTRVSTEASAGAELPLVMVHGLGVSARYMMPTAEHLATYYRVIVPDLPGFGDSGKPSHILNVPELADRLVDWMPHIGLTRANFLGNSLGCQIIVDMAVRYPQLVESAVLVGPTVDSRDRTMLGQLWRGFRDLCREPWSLWPILFHDYLVTGTRRMYRTFKYALQDPIENKLPMMQTPTLVVRGSRDTIVPQPWAEEMTRRLPNGRLVVISGGTHASNYSAPIELAAVVSEFLTTIALKRNSPL